MSDLIETGPVNPERPRGAIQTTLTVLAVLIGLVALLGVGSTLLGQTRRNENILPRELVLYAIQPDGSVLYTDIIRPADQQLLDDDIPFETQFLTVQGPPHSDLDDVVSTDISGAALESTSTISDGLYFTAYNLRREYTDGQTITLTVELTRSPYVTQQDEQIVLELPVTPQQTYAQRMIAVALPSAAGSVSGPQQYRDARVGPWRVYYFDVTLLDSPQTITVRFTPTQTGDLPAPNLTRVETNR
ncbi:MAG: hypothetical protein GYB64_04320 [Chloroflexi bacterium]|nr:hypothetical protein [Chloroflexota bacterium]